MSNLTTKDKYVKRKKYRASINSASVIWSGRWATQRFETRKFAFEFTCSSTAPEVEKARGHNKNLCKHHSSPKRSHRVESVPHLAQLLLSTGRTTFRHSFFQFGGHNFVSCWCLSALACSPFVFVHCITSPPRDSTPSGFLVTALHGLAATG